jgi:predicted metalloprotease
VLTIAGCLLMAACGSSDPGVKSTDRPTDRTEKTSPDTTEPETTESETTSPDTTEPETTESETTSPDTTEPETSTVDTSGSDTTVPLTIDTMAPPSSVEENPNDATIDFGEGKTPQPYDDFLKASLADVQDYWRETYPAVYGSPFPELQGGIWASYPGRTGEIPDGCSGPEDYPAQGNAFYCGNGDYIAYDDYDLIPSLVNDYGESAVGVVFAHEFGHAIQERVGALGPEVPTVYFEQQADCFAGAWTAHVARGESDTLTFGDTDIKAGLSAMVAVKDGLSESGEDVFSQSGHGNAFDRVGAFENGFKGSAEACKDMETNPLPLLDLPFSNADEAASGGNVPYADIQGLVETDLTRFWSQGVKNFESPTFVPFAHKGPFPSCDGFSDKDYPFNALYCPGDNTIYYDDDYARTLYNHYGDFAVGYILSNAWSDAVQTQLNSNLTGSKRALVNDCLTGAWTKDTIPPEVIDPNDTRLYISPGDLDEAVETALLSEAGLGDTQMASAFEKIDYFRAGVIGGISECNNRITKG